MNKEQYLERTVIYYIDSTPNRPLPLLGKMANSVWNPSLLIYNNIQYNVHVLVVPLPLQENYLEKKESKIESVNVALDNCN